MFKTFWFRENLLGEGGAGGGAGEQTPPTPPVDGGAGGGAPEFTPPEWAKGINVEPDILKAPMFSSVKSIDDVVKGYYHAQKMVGADKVVLPTKNSSPEEWKAFYNKLGVPESVDKYELETPFKGTDFETKVKQKAFELNLKPDQAKALIDLMEERNSSIVDDYEKEEQANLAKVKETLTKEWGTAYDRKISNAQKVIKHFGGEDMLKAVVNDPTVGNNETVLRLLAAIGDKLHQEDTFQQDVVTKFGTTKEEAKKKINEMMGDMKHPYHNRDHASHADAIKQMLDLQEILAN